MQAPVLCLMGLLKQKCDAFTARKMACARLGARTRREVSLRLWLLLGGGSRLGCCYIANSTPLLLLQAKADALGAGQVVLPQRHKSDIDARNWWLVISWRMHHPVDAGPLAGGDGAKLGAFVVNAFDERVFLDLRFYKFRDLRVQVTGLFRIDLLHRLLRDRQNGIGGGNIGILGLCDRGQAAQQNGRQSGGQTACQRSRLGSFFGRHDGWISLLDGGWA